MGLLPCGLTDDDFKVYLILYNYVLPLLLAGCQINL